MKDHRKLEVELAETNENLEILVEKLRRKEAWFRELAESITDFFFALDKELRYKYWNRALEEFIGVPQDEVIGKSIYQAFPGDKEARDRLAGVYSEVLRTGEAATYLNKYRLRGEEYSFEINVYPAEEGLVVVAKDVTENLRAQEELLLRTEELDTFALAVSHDLASSMIFISDFAREAQRACDESDEKKIADNLREIIEACNSTQAYVERLIEYARAGYREEDLIPVSSEDIVHQVLDELNNGIEEKGAEVMVSDGLPQVLAGQVKLQQVLRNLINNSLDHARSEKVEIEIGAERDGGEVTFYVRDNGSGISPEIQRTIFLPFKRSQDVEVRGWGMGLALAKRAVESWGGRIWVESDPGDGCCFLFTAHAAE